MIISHFPSGGGGGALPAFSYTGDYRIDYDSGGWKVKFLSSGTLTMINQALVDIFLVGGGGSGIDYDVETRDSGFTTIRFGGGGGGGYTLTQSQLALVAGASYTVTVGTSGNASSIVPVDATEWGGNTYTANGGKRPNAGQGGNGGSGGASSGYVVVYGSSGAIREGTKISKGAVDGASASGAGGTGQGTTTREFGSESGELYASGGCCYYSWSDAPQPAPNSGNGGNGGMNNSSVGASGIVIIRNTRG